MKTGAPGSRRALLPDQSGSGGSGHTLTASRQPGHALDALPSKRVCFYKSGDPQFGGLRMVINRRTFKSFEALLDGLSKKVPLPFGVRNIATPRGVHAVRTLDQLEDGKSYVCSDTRKVKPVDLARARKKLAPWYNARPGTGRRKAVRGGGARPWRQEHEAVSAVQKLTVFRNGEPAVSHAVTLKKRSFEALLELLSELLQLPVVKLHTVDGKRVDGLPGLLLCSGRVVAAGQEPFRPGNYNPQSNKKSVTSASKSRNNSESSQRYFLNQIHNSISESMCDYPSYPTDSMEPENGHMPGSVEPCPDHGTHEQGSYLPKEDDIEKSFRVNQDGSMTVEMKVRLTLKEEETIHWTTTLSRSSVANQLLPECFPTPEPEAGSELEQESDSHDPDHPEPPHSMVPIESTSNDKPRGDDCGNNASSEEGNKEDEVMVKTDNVMSPRRAATPGFRKAKTATDSMRGNTAEEVQEGTVRSYSYRAETERYRMVQQSSTRPVPKPRRMASMDVNYRLNQAEFNSAGMSEVLQIENDGEEVTETVLHIYEQQNCQENFYANTHHHAQGVSMHGALYGRPSTSNSAWSMNADVEPQFGRPSTASESIHTWRADSMLPSSNFPLCKSLVINTQKKGFTTTKDASQLSPETRKDKHHRNVADQANTTSNRKAIKKHVRWIKSPANGRKRSPAEASKNRKKIKPFSSTGFLKKIYGGPPRPVKTALRKKKTSTEKEQVRSAPRGVPVECTMKDPNTGDEKKQETIPFESNMLEVSPKPRATLTHQKSIHEERQTQRASSEVNRAMALPVFNSSSSIINEYVEHWLGNSPSQHELCPSDKAFNVIDQVGLEGGVPEGSEVSCERIKADKGSEVTNQTPELPEVPHRSRLQNELSEESPVVLEPDSSDRIERTERDDRGSAEASATAKPSDNNVPTNSEEGHVNSSDCVEKALVDVKAIVKLFTDPENPEGAHEKPSKPKQQNLSDDQKAVHTPLNTHNEEDSTTDLADTVSLREEQLPIPASQVSTEDKELESGNHRVEEEEVEQCSLNENQPIKSHVPYMDLEETTEESHDENRCSSEGEHLEGESKELDRNSDDSMFSPEELSSSDEERKHILSTEGHHRNICNPGTQKKLSSPKEQRDIELRQLKRVRNNNMSDYKSLSSSEEEEQRLQCTDRFKCSSVTISSTQETSRSVHILPPVDKQIRHKLTKIESLSERSEENRSTPDTEQLVHLEKYQPQVHKPEHQLSCTEATSNPVCKAVELDCKQHIYQDQTFRSRSHPDQPTLSIDSCMGENINGERSSSSRDVAEQSEEGHDDRCNQEQNIHGTPSPEDTSAQRAAPQQKAEPAEIPSQSVAERIGILKKQVADTQWKSNTAGGVGIQILADVASSDVPESPTPDTKMTRALPGSRSAPQSSLSFSYDSSGIPTRQSDGATVQSIKEMFMAKSVPDVLREDRGVHRPISSEHSPASRSQHWDELSEARSIAKGFVRKTIERLYGKKDSTTGDTPSGRHTSSPKHSSIFSSLDAAQSKLRTDMPYFNSTDTLNMSSEVRRCKAFNMQVGPDDSLPTDRDRSLIRKSTSDPAGINKVVETPLLDIDPLEDTRQKVPVSLFSTTSEPEDKLVATKCTYFSLPCASDSEPGLEDPGLKEPGHEDPGLKEPGHEDPGAVSKNRKSSVDIKEEQEEAKDWAERSGTRPGLRLHDNKVQPLTQGTPGGQVVVVQPIRGQGVVHRPMELDALDALYTFCGEHCPIL
ncbi:hypothetical protein NHX12_021675 [Muraenolepis orangiensis]|uniref:Doublecortin domain-containing protein n=1 Tax=Muraenolepis orangiensis TaxID=630683 RepID=A0A9Q0ETZ6_9TELE|nr:hypothetical protein NHX12_021675 [Muraenolepis orangiensis]